MKKHYIAPSADVIGNVKIGEESSIWYRAVVRADHDVICIGRNCNIQDGSLAFGNPAKVRRQLTAEEIEGNKESAAAYVAAARKAFGKAEL